MPRTPLRQRLSIKPGGMLLYRAERPADSNGCELTCRIASLLGVKIRHQGDSETILECDLSMVQLVALREDLVPTRCQIQLLHISIVIC